MTAPIHIHIGKDRRIAIPAQFCEESNIHPGDGFLLGRQGNQLVLTPLADEADRIAQRASGACGQGCQSDG